MFGKLTLAQRKALQSLLIQSGLIAINARSNFLMNAGLESLIPTLPMGEVDTIFAGALLRECERLGKPPVLGEYATVLLVVALREALSGVPEAVQTLTEMIAVYVADHESRYPWSPAAAAAASAPPSRLLTPPIKVAAFFANPPNTAYLASLNQEEQKVRDFLNRQSDFELITVRGTRLRDLLALLDRRSHRLSIFHYSGHASEDGIWLEPEEEGADPDIIPWDGLAIELSHQAELACIVLNGCESAATTFIEAFGANRPSVIAMAAPIGDRKATFFATRLYESLAARDDIPTAFEKACNYLRLKGYRDAVDIPRLL